MALSGALADMSTVELIQFPGSSRKTGELVITTGDDQAHLYYSKGRLVHAAVGALKGPPALVHVLAWSEGRFEFRSDIASPETSIDMDLQHAIMMALKALDEQQEERRRAQRVPAMVNGALAETLRAFVAGAPWVLQVWALAPNGSVLGEAHRDSGTPLSLEPILPLISGWTRPGLRRIFFEDNMGTVVVIQLNRGGTLVVAAAKGVALGAVSVGAGKLASSLDA